MPLAREVEEALALARTRCDALERTKDAMHDRMRKFIAEAEQYLQAASLKQPSLPNRRDYYNRLRDGDSRKVARGEAFEAMDSVLRVGWPPMTDVEKQRRSRDKRAKMDTVEMQQRVRRRLLPALHDGACARVSPSSALCTACELFGSSRVHSLQHAAAGVFSQGRCVVTGRDFLASR